MQKIQKMLLHLDSFSNVSGRGKASCSIDKKVIDKMSLTNLFWTYPKNVIPQKSLRLIDCLLKRPQKTEILSRVKESVEVQLNGLLLSLHKPGVDK